MPELTSQQQAFRSELLSGTSQHGCLRARAGTGKTHTILAAVDAYAKMYPHHEIAIVCYGKGIKQEIQEKLGALGHDWRKVQAATTHSMGWNLVKWAFKLTEDENIDQGKVARLCWAQAAMEEKALEAAREADPSVAVKPSFYGIYWGNICDLINYAKLEGVGYFPDAPIDDPATWLRIADYFGLDCFEGVSPERVIEAAQHIYKLSLADTTKVDYNDMVLFPLIHGIKVRFQKDLICVDEAQDTSRARQELIRMFLKPWGRLMVIGDDRQAIMGFAGASPTALEDLIAAFGCKIMPLTVSWRCAKAVIREAQTIVPDIEYAENAIEGEVINDPIMPAWKSTDVVLCRNSSPLMEVAYDMAKQRHPFKVEGRDFGKGLLKLVNRWSVTDIGDFLPRLQEFRKAETAKARANNNERKVQSIDDRCDCIKVICEIVMKEFGSSKLEDVRKFIDQLFGDDVAKQGKTTLCTYHRSKGREWQRVILLDHDFYSPSYYAKKDWELRQEANLAYVAFTRARETLVYAKGRKPWERS